jgi:RNA polymerase sigma factor (sigma-70 family)
MIFSRDNRTDAVLITMAIGGRSECFSVLVSRHLSAVKNHVRAMVPNEPDQEDILQDVLLKVWRHLADFRAECNFRTWMTKIAINEVRQWYRRRCARPEFQPLEDSGRVSSMQDSPEKRLIRNEAADAVRSGSSYVSEGDGCPLPSGEYRRGRREVPRNDNSSHEDADLSRAALIIYKTGTVETGSVMERPTPIVRSPTYPLLRVERALLR